MEIVVVALWNKFIARAIPDTAVGLSRFHFRNQFAGEWFSPSLMVWVQIRGENRKLMQTQKGQPETNVPK